MAVPCAISSFGSWFIANVVIGIITIAIETILNAFEVARYVNVVCSVNIVNGNVETTSTNKPIRASHLPPNLSNK